MKVQFYDGAVPMGAQSGGQVVLPQDVGAQERVAGWQRVAAGLDRLGKAAVALDEFRAGKLGRISLERPEAL